MLGKFTMVSNTGSHDVYSDLYLVTTSEMFYLESPGANKVLSINRASQEMKIMRRDDFMSEVAESGIRKKIFGMMGICKLLAGPYLVVVTDAIEVGVINQQAIWQIVSTELILFPRSLLHLNEKQTRLNEIYVSMIENVLNTPHLYFSYSYDITHTMQSLHLMSHEISKQTMWSIANTKFLWNEHLLSNFCDVPAYHSFCLPVIQGFVSIKSCTLNGVSFKWSIVSRRATGRAGTRLFTRGVDEQGNVANFVETEQIVESNGDRSSFVQIRGSIPLFWQQYPNLKYKSPPKLIPNENQLSACTKHFEELIKNYYRQVIVNLIDHRGSEGELEKAYKDIITVLDNNLVRYESFDFHHECRKMRWDRLSILINRLGHEQDEFDVFLLRRDGGQVILQDGAFRTNCIDCLDRTNVVQSMLARRSLTNVLQRLNILKSGQSVESQAAFESLFKNVWADHADIISIQYSGTGALKTDFTRTGKRTRQGALRDGINSMTRYYKNNFKDGFRQDAIDLFHGRYIVDEGEEVTHPSPLSQQKGWKYYTYPSILVIAFAMFLANVITPNEYTTSTLLYLLFWGSMVGLTLTTIFYNGYEYVDAPKLRPLNLKKLHPL
ncbi:unnamed protein product [Bemisia tabaci]|uniref:Phosphatidylinositol-3-phosphatase SAC1 n=1 Tax=Bemisia tabaci TaxID=7038 RepID=A0A9P0F782_BEMTA|nr:PREDICTED: phosphatidylinositide phosphatase SAC1-A [Bemisia tabaci]CAH0395313.1 unnamed protein product [Bemisia tabaci]